MNWQTVGQKFPPSNKKILLGYFEKAHFIWWEAVLIRPYDKFRDEFDPEDYRYYCIGNGWIKLPRSHYWSEIECPLDINDDITMWNKVRNGKKI